MRFLALLCLLAALAYQGEAQVIEGCLEPPGNNGVADLIVSALEAARPLLTTGIPSLGIPPLDPLGPINHIPFSVDTDGLRLDGEVNETQVLNIAKFIICSLNFSLGARQELDMDFRLENFHIEGFYNVDGLALSLFPIFGTGDFTLDTYNAGIKGGAIITVNPFTDHASIKDLYLDIFFDDMELVMECILGCGDMSDLINNAVNDIAPPLFYAVWDAVNPILVNAMEAGINDILKNISISDIITPEEPVDVQDLGNGNGFVDLIMQEVNEVVVNTGLDPAPLPDVLLKIPTGHADMYGGNMKGMSLLHRDGTCTLDKVTTWVFLYANIGTGQIVMDYLANVSSGSTWTPEVKISAQVEKVAVYFVARQDIFLHHADIDQFVITDFGKIDVDIDGLGLLSHLAGELVQAVTNLVREDITNMLESTIKDLIQQALNETPWP